VSVFALLHNRQIDIDEFADRASISLTLLLTAVAYKLVTAGMVPCISYLTLIDKYVSSCIFLMFLLVCRPSRQLRASPDPHSPSLLPLQLFESGIAGETNLITGHHGASFEATAIKYCFGVYGLIHVWFAYASLTTLRKIAKKREERRKSNERQEFKRMGSYNDMRKLIDTKELQEIQSNASVGKGTKSML